MNVIEQTKECIGCGACVDVCPAKVLKMSKDDMGFYKPEFTASDCTSCSKCVKVCPSLNKDNRNDFPKKFFCGFNEDNKIREFSTSGGAFRGIAEIVLKNDGVVFGSVYSDDYKTVFVSSTDDTEIESLMRTKYCQSYYNELFVKIKNNLNNNRKVMIVCTPCTASALRRIFKDDNNLLIVDFMCGGVVPQTMLTSYVDSMQKKYKAQITDMNMRDKSRSWDKPHMRIDFNNEKKYIQDYKFDPYLYYYYEPYFKTDLCIHCPFTDHNSSDITIGDFWGYKNAGFENDGKGISLLCANTKNGEKYLGLISDKMNLKEIDSENVSYAYKEKSFSDLKLAKRNIYIDEYKKIGFFEFAKNHEFRYGTVGAVVNRITKKLNNI